MGSLTRWASIHLGYGADKVLNQARAGLSRIQTHLHPHGPLIFITAIRNTQIIFHFSLIFLITR
jgi:hypothetical protein